MAKKIGSVHLLIAASGMAMMSAAPAFAGQCAPSFKEMTKVLEQKYREHAIAEATAGNGALHIFWSQAGTYTVVITMPRGSSCIIAAGEDWEFIKLPPPGEGV